MLLIGELCTDIRMHWVRAVVSREKGNGVMNWGLLVEGFIPKNAS